MAPPPEDPATVILAHYQRGDLAAALAEARAWTTRAPDHGPAWILLADVQEAAGDFPAMAHSARHALTCLPHSPDPPHRLGAALLRHGDAAAAHPWLAQAAALVPERPGLCYLLGIACQALEDPAGAVDAFRRATQAEPQAAAAHQGLAQALAATGDPDGARAALETACALAPDQPVLLNDLAALHLGQHAPAAAEALLQQARLLAPDSPEILANLGHALRDLGRLAEAVPWLEEALARVPDHGPALTNLGLTLGDLGRWAEARPLLQRAWALAPEAAATAINLALAQRFDNAPSAAVALLTDAETRHPRDPVIPLNLATALLTMGRGRAAHDVLCAALARLPETPGPLVSTLMFLRPYSGLAPPAEEVALARLAATACGAPEGAPSLPARPRPATGPLRVGILSHSFLDHPVARFLYPVVQALDPARVTLFAYTTQRGRDGLTAALEQVFPHWCHTAGASDAALLQRLRADRLDLLLDLDGHTEHHRLGVVGQRAAPVQAHWLGYFGTTGVAAMDYWIGDAILSPPSCQPWFTETLWPLPRCWLAFPPPVNAPDITWTPDPETLWLGSFNDLGKMTPETWATWGEILHRLPRARLLLSRPALHDPACRAQVRDHLAAAGVAPDRVTFIGPRPTWAAHMACYNRVDLALDPLGGAGGGTTTAEALWMGVPVVTRAGPVPAQRMSASLLVALGREDWITADPAAYVDRVVRLAKDTGQRRHWRHTQRQTLRESPLCDTPALARALEDAFHRMSDAAKRSPDPMLAHRSPP